MTPLRQIVLAFCTEAEDLSTTMAKQATNQKHLHPGTQYIKPTETHRRQRTISALTTRHHSRHGLHHTAWPPHKGYKLPA
jgi:hypothetical protein